MIEYVPHIVTLIAAIITAIISAFAIMHKANKDNDSVFHAAEISDRSRFRADLMKEIESLRSEVQHWKAAYESSQRELMELKERVFALEMVVTPYPQRRN